MNKCATPAKMNIGGGWSGDPNTPIISHADFVADAVLPALEAACTRFGQEQVAAEIVDVTLPIYEREVLYVHGKAEMPSGEAAAFLSCTLRGGDERGNISANVVNPLLAKKYGIKRVFGPISELGIVHQTTRVFEPAKFFHHHACRMGEVVDNFSEADYLAYIKVCENLLKHGVYDWSIENNPEQWGMLRPSIRLYGMSAVLTPIAQAMIDIAHLPGTKEVKYQYSMMCLTIYGLYPIMMPRVRKNGVDEISKMLQPITDFVLGLSKEGVFMDKDRNNFYEERQFFRSLGNDYIDDIREKGIQQALKELRCYWLKRLTKNKNKS
ncbi:MAG: hypothetical protein WC648_00710 [Candidatus Paceibacterota bacterium]|jgi:hypothetical protein